jgi:rod shape-determining protein MreB and related proteins
MLRFTSPVTRLLQKTLYIKIAAEKVIIRAVPDTRVITDQPVLALDTQGAIRAVGAAAIQAALATPERVTLINPFNHPRLYISDFPLAGKTLTALLQPFARDVVCPGGLMKPTIVMHPLRELAGGLAPFEVTAWLELALSIGGKKGYVWLGRDLTEQELTDLTFPEHAGTVFAKTAVAGKS